MELEIEVLNTGTLAGSTVLNIRSVVNGGVPVFEGSVETGEITNGASSWVGLTCNSSIWRQRVCIISSRG